MNAPKASPLIIHGWTVFAHPLFLAQLETLVQQVDALLTPKTIFIQL